MQKLASLSIRFFQNNKYILLTKRGQDGWILAKFSICVFMDPCEVEVHKNAKRERGQYPAILTELAWSIRDLLYGIPRLHVALCFHFCVCRFLLLNAFLKLINIFVFFVFILFDAFGFPHFLVPSQQRNHRKYFYCHGKYFAKENFRAPAWTSVKFYCENKTGNPKRLVSLYLAHSGSQSEHRIRCILPTRGACHIRNIIITRNTRILFHKAHL